MSSSSDLNPSSAEAEPPLELPPLQEALFDNAGLKKYFSDLSHFARELELNIKGSARGEFKGVAGLAELENLIVERKIWGAQLKYVVDKERWMDTLMLKKEGIRLIRIQHRDQIAHSK